VQVGLNIVLNNGPSGQEDNWHSK